MLWDEKDFYLTLVRHGQTVANVLRIVQGQSDTPLTELGLQQVCSLADYLRFKAKLRFNRVYCSDLKRAYDTCKIITEPYCRQDGVDEERAPENIDKRDEIKKDIRLRERKYGDLFEGKPIANLQLEAYEKGFDSTNFTLYTPEGVESMEEVKARITEFCYETLFKECQHGDEALVVTHWATIKEFLKLFQPLTNGSIKKEHLVETPNVAYCRFRIRCRHRNESQTQTHGAKVVALEETSTTNGGHYRKSLDNLTVQIQTIHLHHTPHLREELISVTTKQQLE